MRRNRAMQITIAVATLFVIVMNFLANALPFNGQNTGEISDRFDVYFVPAGYVFSIWGLIFIALAAFAIYQLLPAQRDDDLLRRIEIPYLVASLANPAWLLLWHYNQFVLTVPVMLILLAALITVYLRLDIGRRHVSGGEKWCAHIPFSLYLGWITVATIANITATLDSVQWNGWGISEQAWAVIMMGTGVAISAWVAATRRDITFLLVIIWAFIGIAVAQADAPLVSTSAIVAVVLVVLCVAWAIYASWRERNRV